MSETNEETWRVGSHAVRVTSLDTLYWPEAGLTKGDLLAYYRDVAPLMLPSFVDRPVTLRVFPDGIHGEGFYRRDLPEHAPDWLRRTDYAVQSGERTIQLPLIDDAASLIWLANEGGIEFHLWSSRAADLEEPDQAVFDLDPGHEASFADVLQTALRLREDLERHGLRGYPKTSGRSGLHVHLPLVPGYRFAEVRSWVKTVAERLAEAHPELIEVASSATHEGRQVAIDYAQNSIARTMAAPYGVRAVPAASVAAPLTWDEVAAGDLRPADLNLRTMLERIRAMGDLFAPLWTDRQRLPE